MPGYKKIILVIPFLEGSLAVGRHAGGLALRHNQWIFHWNIKCELRKIQKISVVAVVVVAITAMAVMG